MLSPSRRWRLLICSALLLPSGCAQSSTERQDGATGLRAPSELDPSVLGTHPGSTSDPLLVRSGVATAGSPTPVVPVNSGDRGMPLGLEEAKSLAIRLNPQAAQDLAAVAKAEGGEEVAFSGYLPTVLGSYSFQAFRSNTGFAGTRGRFPVLPIRGFGPGNQDFNVTEAQLRWNIYQFGRQVAKHGQSVLRVEIAKLQYQRSLQAVEFEVSQSYFQVLESRATLVSARQSVVAAESILKEAGDLLRRGVITPEEVLRAEAESATVRQLLTTARSSTEVSVAGLNRSIGLDINAPTEVLGRREEPTIDSSLEDCLKLAAARRPEIAVVRKGITIADAEIRIARSDFMPTISLQSSLSNVTGTGIQNSGVLGGGAFATLEIYTGGKRKGQLHIATAEARAAVAQAKAVCDAVAYETNVAYRGIEDARERIAQSRSALSQARESFRLMSNRLKSGDAIPAELIGAETALTRMEQAYNTAFYDYQVAIARLEFATGAPIARRGGEVAAPETPEGAPPVPPPDSSRSPFRPGAEERGRGATTRLPSILPPGGLNPVPSPFDEGGPFAPPRPGGPASPRSPGLAPSSTPAPPLNAQPGLARPPYESNPLAPTRPPGSGP
jgi:outer membrane protein